LASHAVVEMWGGGCKCPVDTKKRNTRAKGGTKDKIRRARMTSTSFPRKDNEGENLRTSEKGNQQGGSKGGRYHENRSKGGAREEKKEVAEGATGPQKTLATTIRETYHPKSTKKGRGQKDRRPISRTAHTQQDRLRIGEAMCPALLERPTRPNKER